MPACDLSIIIVSWNVKELLAACLESIAALSEPMSDPANPGQVLRRFGGPGQPPRTLQVIVVDNASSDGTPAAVSDHFPWVQLIRNQSNLGFSAGNNSGFAASTGRFVFFLNPDTAFLQPDSLWSLYCEIEAEPGVGIVGPQLRYRDGVRQESRRRFATPLTGFFESTWLARGWPGNPWARQMHMADWPAEFRQDVDWLVGAALLCRREALLATMQSGETGPFDEGFFMYSEEADLCQRVKQAGWRIVYIPDALVMHYEGKSSEQVVAARHIHFNTSKVRYWRKWFGPAWSQALRRYLLLEYRVQWWVEGAKWLVGHKRALRRERLAAYRQVIASRLLPTNPEV